MRSTPIVSLFSVAFALGLGGCLVPVAQVEEAQSALRVEQRAHRATAERMYAQAKRLGEAERALEQAKQATPAVSPDEAAQAQFDYDVATKQRDEAEAVVEQLRGELARIGGHLKAYAGDRERLAQELEAKQQQAAALALVERASQAQVLVMRDLALEFHAEIKQGSVKLSSPRGFAVIELAGSQLYDADGDLNAAGTTLLRRVAKWVKAAPSADADAGQASFKLEISERSNNPETESSLLRLSQVAEALAAAGVGSERVTVSVDGEDAGAKAASASQARWLVVGISAVTSATQAQDADQS